jgi:hypothetical protein
METRKKEREKERERASELLSFMTASGASTFHVFILRDAGGLIFQPRRLNF